MKTRVLAALSALLGLARGGVAAEPAAAVPPNFRVIAHRGASAHAPENTLPAVERAVALGVREVELDVQLARDATPVLFHDATLDEKTDLHGRVREHDEETLRHADVGSWFDRTHPESSERFAGTGIATLEEVLERFGDRLVYHLEIKDREPDTPRQILAAVRRRGLNERVIVTSFHLEQLERTRALDPELATCLLIPRNELPQQGLERARRAGMAMVAVAAPELSREWVEAAHAQGLEIRAWRVRSDADLARVLAAGADGATVDWPERLLPPAARD